MNKLYYYYYLYTLNFIRIKVKTERVWRAVFDARKGRLKIMFRVFLVFFGGGGERRAARRSSGGACSGEAGERLRRRGRSP